MKYRSALGSSVAALSVVCAMLVALPTVANAQSPNTGIPQSIQLAGTVNLATIAGSPPSAPLADRNTAARSAHPLIAGVVDNTRPGVRKSFDGINVVGVARAQNAKFPGNTGVDPPDVSACVGNGFVLQPINGGIQVFNTAGTALTGVGDISAFHGFPTFANGTGQPNGPGFTTDVDCQFDPSTNRWFTTIAAVGTGTSPNRGYVSLAVSQSGDPRGTWNLYRIDETNDGQDGTPARSACTPNGCAPDQPMFGLDANGVYVSSGELQDGVGEVVAVPKTSVECGKQTVRTQDFFFDAADAGTINGNVGQLIKPANSVNGQFATTAGGTEFMVSALFNISQTIPSGNELGLWVLTNTTSLNNATPAANLQTAAVSVPTFSGPPTPNQKVGPYPGGQCLQDPNCAAILGGPPFPPIPEPTLDAGPPAVLNPIYGNQNGATLWLAQTTAVTVNGQTQAGLAWYALAPRASRTGVGATVTGTGTLGLAGDHLLYPAVATVDGFHAYMTFTLMGDDYFPTPAYVTLDPVHGPSAIHIVTPGQAAYENIPTETKLSIGIPAIYRWGDYNSAVVDGNNIWFATEYIGNNNSCTPTQWANDFKTDTQGTGPFIACGGTRTISYNWDTRLTQLSTS
jgi:hypothetical protein